MKSSVQIIKTNAARGSQSATDPMMVEAEVAEKNPKRMEMDDAKATRVGLERAVSMSLLRPVRM